MKKLKITFSQTKKFPETDYYFKLVLRKAISATLKHEDFNYDCELSVTLTDNENIHKLNKIHRGVDKHTDVLSFPMYEDGDFESAECKYGVILGDIVISLERAREQAAEIGNTFLQEIAFLAIHSTLHLLGYDHERSKEEEELQCKIQKEVMASIEI